MISKTKNVHASRWIGKIRKRTTAPSPSEGSPFLPPLGCPNPRGEASAFESCSFWSFFPSASLNTGCRHETAPRFCIAFPRSLPSSLPTCSPSFRHSLHDPGDSDDRLSAARYAVNISAYSLIILATITRYLSISLRRCPRRVRRTCAPPSRYTTRQRSAPSFHRAV